MIYPYLRLEAPGLDPLVIDVDAGYEGATLDLGDAVVRDVTEDAPDADGTIDTTQYVGARNVTLAVNVTSASLWTTVQRLRAFTHPRLRPTLYVQQSAEAPLQQMTLRRSQWSDVIGGSERANGYDQDSDRAVTVQWVAPLGILESADLNVATANASGGGVEGGRTYDKTFDFTYIGGSVIGETTVTNDGTVDAWPLLRVYGPCTDPVLRNQTLGLQLAFSGLTVNAGEFVEIDTRARTILYNGDPTNGRYQYLSFATSAWWPLAPGENVIRFTPATYTAPSYLEITFRDAWL